MSKLVHKNFVNAMSWHPVRQEENLLCTIGDDKLAQIWDADKPGDLAKLEYDAKERIVNMAWSKEFKNWIMIGLDHSI